jgi:hypothetical protein
MDRLHGPAKLVVGFAIGGSSQGSPRSAGDSPVTPAIDHIRIYA